MNDDGLHVLLTDRDLTLQPLAECHREPLRAACAQDSDIWEIYPFNFLGADFDVQFDRLLNFGFARRAYAICLDDTVVGMTAWLEHGAQGWSIEIGNSYTVPVLRGTGLNTRIKRLMLDHAFGRGLERVVFKVDAINARSRAAVLKLGCSEEGLLRRERRTWTGRVRDTVIYAILRDEWKRQPA